MAGSGWGKSAATNLDSYRRGFNDQTRFKRPLRERVAIAFALFPHDLTPNRAPPWPV